MKKKTKKHFKKSSLLEQLLFSKTPKTNNNKLKEGLSHNSVKSDSNVSENIDKLFHQSPKKISDRPKKKDEPSHESSISNPVFFDNKENKSFIPESSIFQAAANLEEEKLNFGKVLSLGKYVQERKKNVDSFLSNDDINSWLEDVLTALKNNCKNHKVKQKIKPSITDKLSKHSEEKSDAILIHFPEPISDILHSIIEKFASNKDPKEKIFKANKKNYKKIIEQIEILENHLHLNSLIGSNKINCQLAIITAYIKLGKYQEAIEYLDFLYEQIEAIISDIKNYKDKISVELIDYYTFLIKSYACGIQCNLALSKNKKAMELCHELLKNLNIKQSVLEKNKIQIPKDHNAVEIFFKQKYEVLNHLQSNLKSLPDHQDNPVVEKKFLKKNNKNNNSNPEIKKEIKVEIKPKPNGSSISITKEVEKEREQKEKIKELPSTQPSGSLDLIVKSPQPIKSKDLEADVRNFLGLDKEFCQSMSLEINEETDQKIFLEPKDIENQEFYVEFETIKLEMRRNIEKATDLFVTYLSKLQAAIVLLKQSHNYPQYVSLFNFYIKIRAYYMRCLLVLGQIEKAVILKKLVIAELNKHKKFLWKNNITIHTQDYTAVKKLFSKIIEMNSDNQGEKGLSPNQISSNKIQGVDSAQSEDKSSVKSISVKKNLDIKSLPELKEKKFSIPLPIFLENPLETKARIDNIILNLQRYSCLIGAALYEMPEECKKLLIRALQFMDWFEHLFPYHPIFLYGGALRDILWQKTPADLDFVTSVPIRRLQDVLNIDQKLCSIIQLPKSAAGQVSFCTLLLPEPSSKVKNLFQIRCDLKILIDPEKGIIPLLEHDRLTWLDFNVNAIYMNRLGILDAPLYIIRDMLSKKKFIIMPIIKNHLIHTAVSLDKVYPGYNSVEIACLLNLAEDPSRVFVLNKFSNDFSLFTISLNTILSNISALSLVFFPKHFQYDFYDRRDYLVETLNKSIIKFVCRLNCNYKFNENLGLGIIRKNPLAFRQQLSQNLLKNFMFFFDLGILDLIFRSKCQIPINRKSLEDPWYSNFLIDNITQLQFQYLIGDCAFLLQKQMKLMLIVMIVDMHVKRKILRESIQEHQEQIRLFIDQDGWGKSYSQWNKKMGVIDFFDFHKLIQLGLNEQQKILQQALHPNSQADSPSMLLSQNSKQMNHFNLKLSLWKKSSIKVKPIGNSVFSLPSSVKGGDYDVKYSSMF